MIILVSDYYPRGLYRSRAAAVRALRQEQALPVLWHEAPHLVEVADADGVPADLPRRAWICSRIQFHRWGKI